MHFVRKVTCFVKTVAIYDKTSERNINEVKTFTLINITVISSQKLITMYVDKSI